MKKLTGALILVLCCSAFAQNPRQLKSTLGQVHIVNTTTADTAKVQSLTGDFDLLNVGLKIRSTTAIDSFSVVGDTLKIWVGATQYNAFLPGAGGGISNIVEDTTPQLGGDLDANTFDIQFDDADGIHDSNDNEQLIFQLTASAVNYVEITNAATAGEPLIQAVGSDTDVSLTLDGQGVGTVRTLSSNLDITGNIIVSGTVDGKDIATNAGMLNETETIASDWINTANPWADNEVSNTLTSSIFIGSGSTTNAIDLATAEVAGVLADANIPDLEGLSTSLTAGSVIFSDGSNLSQDNANFFWDDINNRLGIGTATPLEEFHIVGEIFLDHTATEADEHALEIDVDAAGFGDIKGLEIEYDTGVISTGEIAVGILIEFNEIDAIGGDVIGLEVLSTDGGADNVIGIKIGAEIAPLLQDSGSFANPTLATNNTNTTDVPDMRDASTGTNTTIFAADNDFIIIGANAAFTEIEFVIETGFGNPGIQPVFAFSVSGTNQFTNFSPTDGTDGLKNAGAFVVAWDADEVPSHVADDVTGKFDIRITRTANPAGSVSLFYAKSAATRTFEIDKDGNARFLTYIFEGATEDANEHTLNVIDPTADRLFNFPDDQLVAGDVLVASDASDLEYLNLATTEILIGDGSGIPTATALSGGATMTNAGVVTIVTNANLTGPITSVGNATSIASQTGSGTTFVVDTSPTIITDITVSTVIGGTGTTSDLNLKTTSGVGASGADMHFLVGNNGATEAMTILNSGNVGIGTTSPDVQLQVENASDAVMALTSGASSFVEIDMGDVNDINIFAIKTIQDSTMEFITNNVVRMAIGDGGGLGIGIVPITGVQLLLPSENEAATPTLAFGDGNTGFYEQTDNVIQISISGVPRWIISSTEFGAVNASGGVISRNAATTSSPVFNFSDDTNTGIGGNAPDTLSLITGGVSRLLIDNNGNIGIGTTTPGTNLEVAGNTTTSAHPMLTMLNDDEQATGETGQTVDVIFEVKGTVDSGTGYTNQEAGKISAFKISDYFTASGEADNDAGFKIFTVTNGAYVLNSTFSDNDLVVVGDISAAEFVGGGVGITGVTASHAGTITWTGTSILETGVAFGFGDGSDATLTHTYANTGTDVVIAYSTAAMAVTGALTATNLSGTNTGDGNATSFVPLPVQSAKLTGGFITVGAGIDAGDGNWRVLFDASVTESILFQFRMPSTFSSGLVAKIQYSMTSATSLKIDWEVEVMAVAYGEDPNSASFDTVNEISGGTTVPGTAGFLDSISITLTNDDSIAAGELCFIRINRDHDDADDTATGDGELVGLTIEWTE